MKKNLIQKTVTHASSWLPANKTVLNNWLKNLVKEVEKKEEKLLKSESFPEKKSIKAFRELIESEPMLYMYFSEMFDQIPEKYKHEDETQNAIVKDYDMMLKLINEVISTAPGYNKTGLVGFPINAILDWAMGTPAGFSAFVNDKVNNAFRVIFKEWCEFLDSEASLYILNDKINGWKSKAARKAIKIDDFIHDENKDNWGFKSWNDFFIRQFKPYKRPVAEPDNNKVIVSACESQPVRISTNVQKLDKFWIKGQKYSLEFMLNNSKYVDDFVGGTVYQAFLSALAYHRWHSPVSGTIVHTEVIEGTYYSESPNVGFDPTAPDLSQAYISQVSTRALIFIKCDDPVIGLMCVMPIGMAEVSTCIITVKEGQKVQKGEQIGYFQFGGSSHCLFFRKGVISEFALQAIQKDKIVKLGSKIAIAN